MLRRFLSYYRPHRLMLAADMIASFFISVIGMIYPVVTNRMLNVYIPGKMYRAVVTAGLAVLGLYVVRMLLKYFVQYYGHMIGVGMQAQMRRDLFSHLESLPVSFYDNNETGRIMTRITTDLFEVSELAHHGPENFLISTTMIVLSFAYLLTINVRLTLIVFTCVPVLVVSALHFRKAMRSAFDDRRKSNAIINAAVESSITGIRVTKAYTNSELEKDRFENGNAKFVEASRRAYVAMAKFGSSTSFITDFFNVLILIAGGLFLYAGRITFGDYSTFIVSVNLFISPVEKLIEFTEQFQNGASGFRRFCDIMDVSPEEDEPGAVELEGVKGDIEFRNVNYSYGKDGEVLHNINLKIPAGSKTALVGPSGGGKTTLCHLLLNFYSFPPECGTILIDGRDIRTVKLSSLRKEVGIVQQDVFLFSGSLMDNIRYGRPDASDSEVVEAAIRADIHDYIMSLENGYDSQIGERGIKLSGGQRQRLSIARVFLKNPSILILDEATSSLDNTTEVLIQRSLDKLCEGRTVLVVAHRLSTVRNADNIVVLSDGCIRESGTHDMLMKTGGPYSRLYALQFRDSQEV